MNTSEEMKSIIEMVSVAEEPADLLNICTLFGSFKKYNTCIAFDSFSKSNVVPKSIKDFLETDDSDIMTYFATQNLYCFNDEILNGMMKNDKYDFPIDYSIMLDTNYSSYIERYMTNPDSLDDVTKKNIEFLLFNDLNFDYKMYIIENYYQRFIRKSSIEENKEFELKIFKSILNLEKFNAIDVKQFKENNIISFNVSESEVYVRTDEVFSQIINKEKNKEYMKNFNRMHSIISLYIVGVLILKNVNKKETHNKIIDLFEYMHSKVGIFMEREFMLFYQYLKNPDDFKIFSTIYKGISLEVLKKNISNIAWDITITRIMEWYIMIESEADFFVPFLMTKDKKLKRVFKDLDVKGIIFNKEENTFIPFLNGKTEEFFSEENKKTNIKYFFSEDKIAERRHTNSVNISNGFKILNEEILELYKILSL